MVTVNARYGFKEPRTRAIQRPDDPIYKAFEKWLEDVPEGELTFEKQQEPHYQSALKIVRKIDGIKEKQASEIQNVLLQYQTDPRVSNSGLFLSACYNTIDQRDLVWDLDIDTRIDYIGYKLGENKRLVLLADSGLEIGVESKGVLINFAHVIGYMGPHAKGPVMNFGSTGNTVGFGSESLAINFRSANIVIRNFELPCFGNVFFDADDIRKHYKLSQYLENFKAEMGKYRNTRVPEVFGIFDVVEQFIGSGKEVNKQFMQKLRKLLD